MMNYPELTQSVIALTKSTGLYLKSMVGQLNEGMIEAKGQADFVTEVDKQSEKLLLDGLSKILPEAGFIAEEGTCSYRGKVFNWIVDPLDGTTNFIHGVIPFAISIALMKDDELVSGVIYDPMQNECFSAWKDGPAQLNGNIIHTSPRNCLSQSLVATGFPYTDFSLIEPYTASLLDLMKCTHGIRRLGSAAIDIAYVACGRYDAFWEYHLKPWDVAAGALIVQQAGGRINDFRGGNDYLFGQTFAATNGLIHNEFLHLLNKYF